MLLCMFVLYSLSVASEALLMAKASKALLMFIVVKSVLCAVLFESMPSKTGCVRVVIMVFVECNGRN